ncbi:MAG: helix-turn-helix transcriptional regulator [Methylacidiphilales bacterium]|nr:helix-turn-helix transcriptional regulator [Candidatus Methylacidiphilales bacterium]
MKLSKKSLDGNMETLLLAVLSAGPSYGYQIVQDLNATAPGLLETGEGTIYPVLHRLEERDLIQSSWRAGENGRQRRYYRITPKGKKALSNNRLQWATLKKVMGTVLGDRPAPDSFQPTTRLETAL